MSSRPDGVIRHPYLLMAAVIALGFCPRIPVLSVSPLLDTITHELSLTAAQAGWLGTIPVICFGTIALIAPALTRRWGMNTILLGMFVLILVGVLLRTLPPVWILFGGTVLVGAGIAVINVVAPGFIKREAPNNVGQMTALYSAAISASGAIGAGATIPIMNTLNLDWRAGLRWPAVVVLIGILVLLPWQSSGRSGRLLATSLSPHVNLWRDPVAWFVTGYMGAQAFVFIATTAWLPTYLIAEGMSEQRAGFMLSLAPLAGVAGAFIAPLLIYKRSDQRWLVWVSGALCAIGLAGVVWIPTTATIAWVLIFGFGSGMTLSIGLSFIGLRTPDAHHASTLSMMAQAVGFSIAALGPIGIGLAHDLTGSWRVAFFLILLSTILLTVAGLGGGKSRLVAEGRLASPGNDIRGRRSR